MELAVPYRGATLLPSPTTCYQRSSFSSFMLGTSQSSTSLQDHFLHSFTACLASSNLHQLYRRPRDALVSVGGRQELVLEVHQLNRQPSELIFKFPSSFPHR